ncbi:hypothetical protein BRADI_2g26635v3 [Brachypodium distachyon]|uniref:Reverse transcriptase zinc-binding domain-containing protein n=1 Tax=Brachypodium distachyon TaxID=15368 RepID=A0A2K2DAQ6_BRADI|nr:hypothetical protein BRADI_2g26635v3 [Brachypodium distachyon]
MLQKRQFHVHSFNCIMCEGNVLETRDHVFFHCKFAKSCWQYLWPDFSAKQNAHANVIHFKEELRVPFHLEIMVLCAWSIWKTRNDFIFNNITPSFYRCRRLFKEELNLVFHRSKKKKYVNFETLISHFR